MKDYTWRTRNLPTEYRFRSNWNHSPTVQIRVPEIFKDWLLERARELDMGGFPSPVEEIYPVLGSLEIEELEKINAKIYEIIARKKDEQRDKRLDECILFLSQSCDGARSKDSLGFNKFDAGFGGWLAFQLGKKQPITRSIAAKALDMLQKYINQLSAHGLEVPGWEEISEQYEDFVSDGMPDKFVEINGKLVSVRSPYDPSGNFQKLAKTIQGYRFNNFEKCWTFPISKIMEICDKFPKPEYIWSSQVEKHVSDIEDVRQNECIEREEKALQSAQQILRLINQANLDACLSNGWYLREYQKKGVEWLLAHRKGGIYRGGILADHMGLGKTLTALVAAKAMHIEFECPVIVICPVSLMEGWRRAAEVVELGIEIYSNSYQKIPAPLECPYLLIVDEAHAFQNQKSKRTQKLLNISQDDNCLAVWLLTGTPMKNGCPLNLMPLLMAIGHSIVQNTWHYLSRYCNAHQKTIGSKTIWDFTGHSFLNELSQKTEDAILCRRKDEVLMELPTKTRLFREAELEPKQHNRYKTEFKELVANYRQRVKSGEVSEGAEALVTINILRKLGSKYKSETAIAYAEMLLEQGQQVVIFSEFIETAEMIHNTLGGELLTGKVKPSDRQTMVDRFQSGESRVFTSIIKAGGVGLTLTAASNVILVDRAWSPGDNEQAEDRCHRISQNNAVFATWIQLGQIDRWIDELNTKKSKYIELMMQGKLKTIEQTASPKDLAKELLAML